jgi:AAA domain
MAISMASMRRSSVLSPPTLIVYGPEGLGKTTIAAGAPNPVFAQLEDGLGVLDAPTFGLLKSYNEVVEVISALATEDHDRKTLALDSLDWLERLVWQEACSRNGWDNISSPGYGDGYTACLELWRYLLDGFAALRNRRDMGIIFIAHAAVVKFNSPEVAPYDRYTPKLHESAKGVGANPLLREAVDCVFFTNWKTSVVNDKTTNNKKDVGHNRGVGGSQRMLYTEQRPAFIAKNRYSMPAEIMLPNNPDPATVFGAIAQYIPYYAQSSTAAQAA